MKNLGLLLISFLITVAGLGCATQKYGFRPTGPVATAEAGFPASHYRVPPEAPKGEIFLTSFGTREIDSDGAASQLIHVRFAVSNQSGETAWTVDPGQQLLAAPGAPPQRPDFMEIDGRQDGNATIARGQRRVFDLYYRMPGGARDARAVPAFDLQWQVNTGDKIVAERTTFAREAHREYDYDHGGRTHVAVGVGVGAPWWGYGYGPYWGMYGPWGYPYGPHWGVGIGYGYGYRHGYRPYYGGYYGGSRYGGGGPRYGGGGYGGGGFRGGGGGGGGFRGGGGGGGMRAPTMRGGPR